MIDVIPNGESVAQVLLAGLAIIALSMALMSLSLASILSEGVHE